MSRQYDLRWEKTTTANIGVDFSMFRNRLNGSIEYYNITTNYPDAKMLKIERDKYDYEVKLSNGWEIKFDMQFNVIDIDN